MGIDSIRQKTFKYIKTIRWVRHFKLHLLVSSLNGAVSLKEVDDITVFVTCGERGDKKRSGLGRSKENSETIVKEYMVEVHMKQE